MSKPVGGSPEPIQNDQNRLPPIVKIGKMDTASKSMKVKPQTSSESFLPEITQSKYPVKLEMGTKEKLTLPPVSYLDVSGKISQKGMSQKGTPDSDRLCGEIAIKTGHFKSQIPILPPLRSG